MPCKVLAILCSRGLLLVLLLGAQRCRLASSEVVLTVRVQAGEGEGWWYLLGWGVRCTVGCVCVMVVSGWLVLEVGMRVVVGGGWCVPASSLTTPLGSFAASSLAVDTSQ